MKLSRLIPAFALTALACSDRPDDTAVSRLPSTTAQEERYVSIVHAVVERHCGSGECHGRLERGLRVLGASALRLPGAVGPTTAAEARETYRSILGLQPEATAAFLARRPVTDDEARALTFISKAIERERHRGGLALRNGEAAERCLVTWLTERLDEAACKTGSTF